MKKYIKWNNKRSEKAPYYIFATYEDYNVKDMHNHGWVIRESEMLPSTEEEYNKAKAEFDLAMKSVINPGDMIICKEYPHTPIKATGNETTSGGYGYLRIVDLPFSYPTQKIKKS
jgi:hypothetical protein